MRAFAMRLAECFGVEKLKGLAVQNQSVAGEGSGGRATYLPLSVGFVYAIVAYHQRNNDMGGV